jgi:hypothetical protein
MDPSDYSQGRPIISCTKGLETSIVNRSVYIYILLWKTTYNANTYTLAEDLFVASMVGVNMKYAKKANFR